MSVLPGPIPGEPEDLWSCTMCTATNGPERVTCRVCRTSLEGQRVTLSRTLDEDTFAPAPLRQVIPFALALLVVGALAASQIPKASTWAGGVAPGGWQVGVRVNRAHELRLAARELAVLVEQYEEALAAGAQPDEAWSRRLATLRKTWEIYGDGDRFPGLESPEIELASAMHDIASLRAMGQDGDTTDTTAGLLAVTLRIQKTEDFLSNVD
ncbi:MAG: zinc finger Ran-binding domain-containing protein [Pseudomonadota bacterium]|nr:zinc finger Ran-binding domain-containing protein [Pseudomonadota bacterium]